MNITKFFMSASMEEQIQRNHLSFGDKSKELKTRIKSLQNLVKFYQENSEELSKLYNTNYIEIFDLRYSGLIKYPY